MHRRQSADDGKILHDHMAGQRPVVGHDYVVAQLDIVCDVAVGEDVIVGADHRRLAVASAAVDGDVFAEGIAVPDARPRGTAFPF